MVRLAPRQWFVLAVIAFILIITVIVAVSV